MYRAFDRMSLYSFIFSPSVFSFQSERRPALTQGLLLQMRTMSGETEPRVCREDFGSDEGDVESYLEEEDNSSELLDRLRELEVRLGHAAL